MATSNRNTTTTTTVYFLALLLLFEVLVVLPSSTSAFTFMTSSRCSNFTFPDDDDGTVRELCFSIHVTGPSISVTTLSNGTEVTEYVGESSEEVTFEENFEGIVTNIRWDEAVSTVDCVASVTYKQSEGEEVMECTSCALCDDGTSVSADCTNLKQGRNVACGENAMAYFIADDVAAIPFFPFVSTFEHSTTTTTTTSTTAPAPAPVASGSSTTTLLSKIGVVSTGGAFAMIMMLLSL